MEVGQDPNWGCSTNGVKKDNSPVNQLFSLLICYIVVSNFSVLAMYLGGSYPIVVCVFYAAGMCLPSRCLATGIHVTI
jgi:hypothetical protein